MTFKTNIKSQYFATLAMLQQAVVRCPQARWDDPAPKNAFWQVAYHVLFYTHLYLQPTEKEFHPWAKNRRGYQQMEIRETPYSQADILEYIAFCREQVEQQIECLDLDAPSGFHWLPFNKLELQFYNIRHLQHHTGELCERLGVNGAIEIDWVSTGE
jgi:hypothetical protein